MMQKTSTDLMCYYDGGLGYSMYRCLINPDHGYPYRTYYAFAAFNTLYRLGNEVAASTTDEHVLVGAGVNGGRAAVVLANTNAYDVTLTLDLTGFAATDVQVLRIDEGHRYTLTGETIDGALTLPAASCVEIKLWHVS